MSGRKIRFLLGFISMFCVLAFSAQAQEVRATLGGKVTDPKGAAIRDAAVSVTSVETGVVQTTKTDNVGNWRVSYLNPGHYTFEITAPGFRTSVHEAIELQIADQKFLDMQLEIGASHETVTVSSAPPLIDTTAATSGTVITTEHLMELPSQSNVATLLVGLTPGAIVATPTGANVAHLWSNASASNVSVNGSGSGSYSMNYTIDGAANTTDSGQVAFVPPMDAIAEFRVTSNAYDASIGRQGGGTINMSLKTGTKNFHGTLYENNQNNFLNANFFQNKQTKTPVPPIHVNEFGGTVGGPVWLPKIYDGRKKQTFFFFSYNYIINKAPGSQGYMSIPTMAEREGDFSQSYTVTNGTRYPVQVYDPLTIDPKTGNRQLFPNNKIPSDRISPVAKAYFKLMPAPDNAGDGANSDSNNYVKRTVQDDKMPSYAARIDHTWNNEHHSYVSLRYNTWKELSYDPFGPDNLLQGLWQQRVNKGITLDHTWMATKNLLLDLRYNVTGFQGNGWNVGAGADATKYGFSSSFAALAQRPSLPLVQGIVSGAETGGLGTNQVDYGQDTFQTIDINATQSLNNHTLRYGYEYMIQQRGNGSLAQTAGVFSFGNNWTLMNPNGGNATGVGSNIGSFLLGLPTSGSIPNNVTNFWSQHYTALFLQDDWRVTDKLTVNLGLRWDYERPTSERFNRIVAQFDPTMNLTPLTSYAQPNYAALISGSSSNLGVQLLQQNRSDVSSFVARGGVIFAGQNGASKTVVNTMYKYVQPRIGFAYRLRPTTVIRGGLGRFVQASLNLSPSQTGFSQSTTFVGTNDNYYTVAASLADPFPTGKLAPTGNTLGALTNPGTIGSFYNRNIGRVYVDEASFHVQQQVKDYLFELGGTLNMSHNLNVQDYRVSNTPQGYNINVASRAAWQAAYGPVFDSTGRPVNTLPGDVQVTNPFLNAPYLTNSLKTTKTIAAYQLVRPNPLQGDLYEYRGGGSTTYYALLSKIERRYSNGFSLLQSFTWAKSMNKTYFKYPQPYSQELVRELDPNDVRFHDSVTITYILPFGRGAWLGRNVSRNVDRAIGGWKLSGIYQFQSGTPLNLPTNTAFFKGGNPSLGSKKTSKQWFDTSYFKAFPNASTTVAQLQAYPSWTGVQNLPGYNWVPAANDSIENGVYQDFKTWTTGNPRIFGNIRNPYLTDFTLGIHKSVPIADGTSLQLRMDIFNLLNHPRFGSVGTDPNGAYFGVVGNSSLLSQVNAPRSIQLQGKIVF